MSNTFYKYHGTGNDFILIDNRDLNFPDTDHEIIKRLCNRNLGIGADGLMLLQNKLGYDFEMVYFNSDGNRSTMCGNGGRCIVQFAKDLGIIENETTHFFAIDGPHASTIKDGLISLQMQDVAEIENGKDCSILNTGSPHFIVFGEDPGKTFYDQARFIRYDEKYKDEGINVNFSWNTNPLFVRTYERGVENETMSCGTGVTACVIAAHSRGITPFDKHEVEVSTPGGMLKVTFEPEEDHYRNIWLHGPATFVFEGEIDY